MKLKTYKVIREWIIDAIDVADAARMSHMDNNYRTVIEEVKE